MTSSARNHSTTTNSLPAHPPRVIGTPIGAYTAGAVASIAFGARAPHHKQPPKPLAAQKKWTATLEAPAAAPK